MSSASHGEPPPLDRRVLQDRAIRGASWTIIHTVVAVPVGFLVNLVLARSLGSGEYGRLAVLTTLMTIAMGVLNGGPSAAVLQFGSKAHAARRTAEVAHLLSISQGLELLVVAPALTVVIVVTAHVPVGLLVAAVVFGIWAPAYLNQALLGLVIENKTSANAKIAMLSNLVSQVLVVVLAVTLRSADAVWLGRLVVSSVLVVLALVPLDPTYRRALMRPRLPRHYPPGFWRFAVPTGVAGVVSTLVTSRTEVFVLEWMSTSAEVGVFALAFGLAGHLFAPAQALVGPLLPAISGLREVDEASVLAALHRTLRASGTLVAALSASVLPSLTLLIGTLYGTEFDRSSSLFLALGIGGAFLVVATPVSVFVQARLQGRQLLVANLLALAVDVVLALSLVPLLGAWGAVIANLSGSLTLVAWLLRSELGGRAEWKTAAQQITPLGYGILAGLVAWQCGRSVSWNDWWAAAMAAALGLSLLYLSLRFGRSGLTRSDADALTRTLPPRLRSVAGRCLGCVTFRL